MVVLDSDILVGILRGEKDAVDFVDKIETEGEKLNTTVINACELFQGALLHHKKDETLKKVENLLSSFGLLIFTSPVSLIAAEIFVELRKKGTMIDVEDIYIAAISRLNDEAVVTRNTKHFNAIKGLAIKKW